MPSIIKRLFWLLALLALATIAETASAQSGFAPVYRGGICVADGTGACIGGDIRAESGLGPQVGYMKTSSDAGTVAVYRSTCYSDTAGNCTAWGLSLDVNGTPVGYLSTTAPDTQSANSPLVQSNGLLLQNLGGTPSAFVWTTIPPNISSLSPTSGPVGTPVTISGTNFGATQGTSTVTFNGVTAAPSSWSDTSIVAPVPLTATTGLVVVTVNGSASNGLTFTVTGPSPTPDLVVSSLSNPPASAVAGGSFDVTDTTANTGTGSAGASTTRYRLSLDSTITSTDPLLTGTRSVPSLAAGANSTGTVSVTVPGGLSPGSYFLGACADDLGVVSESNETNNCRASTTTVVVSAPPNITTLSPNSGPVGTAVTVTGTNFGATQGTSTVTFNGVTATPTSWSSTSLVTPVPAGATTGPVVVSVGGVASNGVTFTVTTKLAVTSINGGANPTAGAPFSVVVQSQDAGGAPANVSAATSVTLSLKTGTGILGGTLTGTIAAGSNQVTISGVTYTKAESGVVITATRTSGDALSAGDSAPFTVNPGAPTKLAFTVQPANAAAGTSIPGPPTVVVQDSQGNTVTTSTASITVAIGTNPGGGTLSGTTTKNAVSGVASFTDLSINKSGSGYTLMASATGLTGATSSAFNITAAAATKLAFTVQPGNATAGATIPGPPTVTVRDAFDNTVTTSTASITLAIGTNPGGGTLSGTTTKNAVSGVASFTDLSINQAGNGYTLTASSTGLAGASSGAFNITQPPANITFVKTIGTATPSTTGTTTSVTIPAGGVAAGNSIIVAFALDPATGAVSCNDTPGNSYAVDTDITNGSGTSGVRTVVLSAHNVLALAGGNSITCTHPSVGKRALGANEFSGISPTNPRDQTAAATGNSTTPSSGSTAATTQAAEMLFGAIGVEGPAGDTFTAGTGYTTIGRAGTTGAAAASNITVNPEYQLVSATGTYAASGTLGASRRWGATIVTYKAATSAPAPTKLAVLSVNGGSNPSAGVGFPVVVQSQDASGAPANVTAATGITLSLKTGTGTLAGTLTGTIAAGANQVTISGVTYTKAESGVVLTATRTSGDLLTSGDSPPFTVNPGDPSRLLFTTQPGSTLAGSPIPGPSTIAVQDNFGNTVSSSTALITVAIDNNPGGGTLSGTTTKNAVSGVASFTDLSINKSGTGYTLTASATGLTGATSTSFNISAAAAAKLAFTTQPGNATAGGTIPGPPTVTVLDAFDNTVTTSTASITVGIGTNPGGGTLSGTTTKSAVSGVASFSDLSINNAGTGYTLTASSTGLTGATSAAFNITPNTGTVSGTVVRASDGIPISGALVEALQSGAVQGSATTAANGSYSIPGLPVGTYDVRASAAGFVTQTQPGINVTAGVTTTVNFSLNQVPPSGTGIVYIYDRLSRLRAVVDLVSDTGIYNYDAVGNLLSIARQSSSAVSVIEMTTTNGPAGTAVTIFGTGFSTTASQNTVTFNGVAATVTSASQTQITTTVPPGATTGPVVVTTPTGSGSSSEPFTVTASTGAPVITGLSPAVGAPGDSIAISGSGFEAIPSNNRITFNVTRSDAASASASTITTAVPNSGTSGRVSVATPLGKAVSTDDFFIPPFSLAPADVGFTSRMSIGGNKTVTISSGSNIGLVVFDGTPGQQITLNISGVTFPHPVSVSVRSPENTPVVSKLIETTGGTLGPVTLASAGTYTIAVVPRVLARVVGCCYSGDGGPATNAHLSGPSGVATDMQGNLFFADYYNNRIRKIDTNGIITTVAGNGAPGYSGDDGPATNAQINFPWSVTIDAQGNLFIADFDNNRIRKVTPSGIITTVAGNGTPGAGGDGGLATSAQLNGPAATAVDPQGNLYIADHNNNRIRKVDTNGLITTVAGNGTAGSGGDGGLATSAQLNRPAGLVMDGQGNLFLADYFNHRIRKVDIGGVISTVAGTGVAGYSGDGGLATGAQLKSPSGVALDAQGNLFIADYLNYRIRKVDSLGLISTVAGVGTSGYSGDGGPAASAQISGPWGIAIDVQGNLFISDDSNSVIRKVDTNGIVTTIAGTNSIGDGGPVANAMVDYPIGLAKDIQGNLYVADYFDSRVRKISTDGIITTVAGNGTSGYSGDGGPATSAQINGPWGISLDGSGNLFIAENSNDVVRKVDPNGVITTVAGTGIGGYSGDGGPATSARLNGPQGVAADSSGNLYITDTFNHRVRKVAPNGIITTIAGTGALGYNGDGIPATSAQLHYPIGLVIDSANNLYIADDGNNRIRKVDAGGIITTVAGNGVFGYNGENIPATSANLSFPQGVALDSQGNLFIAEERHRVRKVNTSGIISTLTGTGEPGFNGDNLVPTLAQVSFPTYVLVDSQGNIFISDSDNLVLRQIFGANTGNMTLTLTSP